jgi:ADP-ribose pyrophosphatase YjhB (NUDIX family)
MLHHIQKSIINVLATTDPARYADLKPVDMDGNQFTYHLKQLMTDKMVVKNDDGTYSLTEKGRTYLVYRYENLDKAAHTIFLVIIRHQDKVLLRERKVQPMLGYVGFVHGEPVADESLNVTVQRRIKAKTGIDIDPNNITTHGSGLIRIVKDGQTQSFSHAIIVETSVNNDELPIQEDETGRNFWLRDDDQSPVKNLPSNNDIIAYSKDSAMSWFDWTYEI